MRRLHFLAASVLVTALLAVAPAAPGANKKPSARVVLPSWTPKHPSPEFLKAARTLRPIPEEAKKYSPIYVPAWEMFGSLSDKQLEEFLTPRQLKTSLAAMPARVQKYLREHEQAEQVGDKLVYSTQMVSFMAKTFTPRQRALWDSFVQAWREANKGQPDEDLLVELYKWGAKKDLSNVMVGFSLHGKHAVNFDFAVVTPKSGGTFGGEWVAQM